MKKYFLLFFISLNVFVFCQEKTKTFNNKLRIYYPVHYYNENEYGNIFIANGKAFGIEYTRLFNKQSYGFFVSTHFHTYNTLPIGIKWDPQYYNRNYLISRHVAYLNTGFDKNIYRLNNFKIDSKYFGSFRYGYRVARVRNGGSVGIVEYYDIGIGSTISLNYQLSKSINIGSDYSLIGYLYLNNGTQVYGGNYKKSARIMSFSAFITFSF